jgi:hypothetical protein
MAKTAFQEWWRGQGKRQATRESAARCAWLTQEKRVQSVFEENARLRKQLQKFERQPLLGVD